MLQLDADAEADADGGTRSSRLSLRQDTSEINTRSTSLFDALLLAGHSQGAWQMRGAFTHFGGFTCGHVPRQAFK